jgi:hypothetical protein
MFDGRGQMYLHTDWDKFSHAHNLEVGCVLNFVYESHDKMSVKVFDDTGTTTTTTTRSALVKDKASRSL